MKIVKDGIVLNPKETHTDDIQVSDAIVKQKSEEIEKNMQKPFDYWQKEKNKIIK